MQVLSILPKSNHAPQKQNKNQSKISFGNLSKMKTIAATGAGGFALFSVLVKNLPKLEPYTLFMPNKKKFFAIPDGIKKVIKNVSTQTEDGLNLKHYYIPAKEGKKTIIFCHGIRHNVTKFFDVAQSLYENGYGAFMMEYRGFGHNKGIPSEKGLSKDFNSVAKYLNKQGIKDENIVVWGFSLGGGVATNAAKSNRLGGVILNSTFTDFGKAVKANFNNFTKNKFVKDLIEKIPVEKILVKSKFNDAAKISEIDIPILIMHAKDDKRVPYEMSVQLAKNKPDARLYSVEKGGHTPFFEWTEHAILNFLAGLKPV